MKTFEELLKVVSPTLKRITYKLNGHYAFFNHDDLYQEALLRLWLDFKKGKLQDKTRSYILQGCYFHLKNYIRTHRLKKELVSLDAPISGQECASWEKVLTSRNDDSPREEAQCKMLIESIRNNGLTDREKDVFLLCLEGLTTREIGKRLNISHVRVIVLQKSMREKCRRHLDR